VVPNFSKTELEPHHPKKVYNINTNNNKYKQLKTELTDSILICQDEIIYLKKVITELLNLLPNKKFSTKEIEIIEKAKNSI